MLAYNGLLCPEFPENLVLFWFLKGILPYLFSPSNLNRESWLIDEYDKPILDNIEDRQTAITIREELKNFYSVLKDADPYLKFCFITGVSKFSKVSLFSGLNNLEDITLSPSYATICGYTQEELETVFADRLQGVDLAEVQRWYNGYNFLGEPLVWF